HGQALVRSVRPPRECRCSMPSGRQSLNRMEDKGRDEFTVSLTDYPSAILKSKPEPVLEGVRIGVEADLRPKWLDERPTSPDGYPGRQHTLELPESKLPGGGIYKVRAYLVKQRLDQVEAVTPKANASSTDPERFFQSFRLSAKRGRGPVLPAPVRRGGLRATGGSYFLPLPHGGSSLQCPVPEVARW